MMHKLVLIPLLYYDNVIVYSIKRNFFENILTVGHKIKIDGPAPPVMKSFVAQIQKKTDAQNMLFPIIDHQQQPSSKCAIICSPF